jgi:heme-degrading monooxygenase HmoA
MVARVTLFDMDLTNVGVEQALERYKALVLPDLRLQPGYQGLYVLLNPEGKGLLMTLWDSEEAADAGIKSGYYDRQVAKLITLFKEPPGREHYQVVYSELPQRLKT